MAKYPFLTDEWLEAAKEIREASAASAAAAAQGADEPDHHRGARSATATSRPTWTPPSGELEMDLGHLDNPDLTVTVDYATAKAILVEGNPQAGMQAFMAGKIKVQGDMTKLMAMQSGAARSRRPQEVGQARSRRSRSSERAERRFRRGRPSGALRHVVASSASSGARRGRARADDGHRRRRRGRPRRRRRTSPTASARAACTACITWMPMTTPTWFTICWVAPAMPRSSLVDGVGDRRRHRRRRRAHAEPGQRRAAPTIDQVAVAGRRRAASADHRRRRSTPRPTTAGDPLADPQREVAGDRAGDGEHERPGDRQRRRCASRRSRTRSAAAAA